MYLEFNVHINKNMLYVSLVSEYCAYGNLEWPYANSRIGWSKDSTENLKGHISSIIIHTISQLSITIYILDNFNS